MGMTEKQGGSDVRANTTRAVAQPDGTLPADRAQVVHLRADERPVPRPRAARGGRLLLPRAAGAARRQPQRVPRSSGSRTSSATGPTPPARSSSTGRRAGSSASPAAACRRSSRWSTPPGWTACWARRRPSAPRSPRRSTTPRHRRAFGALLADQPLMQNVLADLAVESEAATALAIRLAAALDAGESAFLRLAGAAAKFWVCKRTPGVVAEAMEVLGGNGYVEESGLPRLYRQSPLNSIWEGSGNVIALDVLRAMGRSSDTLAAVTRRDRARPRRRPPLRRRRQAAARRARRPRRTAPPGAADRRTAGAVPAGLAAAAARPGGRRRRVLRLSPGRGLGRRPRHAAGRHGGRGDHRARSGRGCLNPRGNELRSGNSVGVPSPDGTARARGSASAEHDRPRDESGQTCEHDDDGSTAGYLRPAGRCSGRRLPTSTPRGGSSI